MNELIKVIGISEVYSYHCNVIISVWNDKLARDKL